MRAERGGWGAQDPSREKTAAGTHGAQGAWEVVLASLGREAGIVMATEDFRNHPVQCSTSLAALENLELLKSNARPPPLCLRNPSRDSHLQPGSRSTAHSHPVLQLTKLRPRQQKGFDQGRADSQCGRAPTSMLTSFLPTFVLAMDGDSLNTQHRGEVQGARGWGQKTWVNVTSV